MHGRSNLLVVQWLGLSVQVRVRVRARDGKWVLFLLFFSTLTSDKHHLWRGV